jgi:hypothetical protein
MRMLFLAMLLVLFQADALSKSGGKGAGSHTHVPAAGAAHSGGGGGMSGRLNPRNVPPLATERRIHEQDCSKPVDWSSGNVKCK